MKASLTKIFQLLTVFILPVVVFAQVKTGAPLAIPSPGGPPSNLPVCATDALLNDLRKDPRFRQHEDDINRQIKFASSARIGSATYILPVVFHVVGPNPNVYTDAQILAALKTLNDCFSAQGAFASSVDTKIQFCLARKDPQGGNTTGITRTVSGRGTDLNPVIEDDKLKDLNRWDPSRYINIWVVNNMDAEIYPTFQCGVWARMSEAGYATFPGTSPISDGIVVAGLGGTLLEHEMGHYLSLYHTFEGMNCVNNNCDTDGDKVCDTPPDQSTASAPSCATPTNSCSTDTLSSHSNGFFPVDVPDMISNIMDYGNDPCHNAFTEGQAERMRAAISTQRTGLLQNECDPPCPESSVAVFTRDKALPVPGDVVNFTNNSTGAANYEWQINGVTAGNSKDLSTSFTSNGTYTVTLKVYNADANCFATYTDFVLVSCGVMSRFYTNKRTIASKDPIYLDSILFTNTSENATSYQWLLKRGNDPEQVVATSANVNYVFKTPGNYTMRLIATNGACSDTTEYFPIPVADPTQDAALFMTSVDCYQNTKIKVNLFVCNNGYATIPSGMPISFYDGDPRAGNAKQLGTTVVFPPALTGNCCSALYNYVIDVKEAGTKQLYAVFNDSGKTKPFHLPGTTIDELNYNNNFSVASNFQFHVTITPASDTLQPGDSLQFHESVQPPSTSIVSYQWSDPDDLTCINCANPYFIAARKIYNSTKRLITANSNGCLDTAYATVKIPAYDNFSVKVDSIACAGIDSIVASFTVCNSFKRPLLPKDLPIAFFNTDPSYSPATFLGPIFKIPADIYSSCASFTHRFAKGNTMKIFAVVNDTGNTSPARFPSAQQFAETSYLENIGSVYYEHFKVTVNPSTATLEPGDSLGLKAVAGPEAVASYTWSNADWLSCVYCDSTLLIAGKKDINKQMIAVNKYGCADTATVQVKVPPADDFTVSIDSIHCSKNDSLLVWFTVCNLFKRGEVPPGLNVVFYDSDPRGGGAHLLGPAFITTATGNQKCFSLLHQVKGVNDGTIYAAVNNVINALPISFPQDTNLVEKSYTNNTTPFTYKEDTVLVAPSDTTVFRKESVPLTVTSSIYDPGSLLWNNGPGYSLSCNSCLSTVATVTDNSRVRVQTSNRYGCTISGEANLKIFPPDMEVKIVDTKCFTNGSTRVVFTICMNNGYDNVFKDLPVAFYDGNPFTGNARLLTPVFYTRNVSPSGCDSFVHVVSSPVTNRLFAVVNDRGGSNASTFNYAMAETNYKNDTARGVTIPYVAGVNPTDTSILRNTPVTLQASVSGGLLTRSSWAPATYLSCSTCTTTVATPPFTQQYEYTAYNEYGCSAKASVVIKTLTTNRIDIPNAFSPNSDGRNDVFYIMGHDVKSVLDFGIYDRWGEKVFGVSNVPANSPAFGWNGTQRGQPAPAATYVYVVKVLFNDGSTEFFKGTIILVR